MRNLSKGATPGIGGYMTSSSKPVKHFDKRVVGADLLIQLDGTTATVYYSHDTRYAFIAVRDGCSAYMAQSGELGRGVTTSLTLKAKSLLLILSLIHTP